MTDSLPADPPSARRLTAVLPELISSLRGEGTWFPAATSAIVFVIDGLGTRNLSRRAGHARFLSGAMSKRSSARTVYPSTTAAALTSLLTGVSPGEHGVVGYRARIPGSDQLVNQLHGWDNGTLAPSWLLTKSLLSREAAAGRPCFVASRTSYEHSGFTRATLAGVQSISTNHLGDRVQAAADAAAAHPGAIVYLYAPELDQVGHSRGSDSDAWGHAMENIDSAAHQLSRTLARGVGAVVTADHGMVDVPAHRHRLLGEGDPLLDGVRLIGGEPRLLHLYVDGDAAPVAARWRASESGRAWVLTREQAVHSGLFGPVADDVRERIGDVLVAARAEVAYYDDREPDKASQQMVGQHGSFTDAERIVPLIPLGAFA